jgi:WD40 repeat protein
MRDRVIRWSAAVVSSVLASSLLAAPTANAEDAEGYSAWSEPVRLDGAVNLPGSNEQHPAISKNGLSLYFVSDRGGPGTYGEFDIYVARRASRGDPWDDAVNLGPVINTVGRDFAPNFSPDGHWMYFHSSRPGGCNQVDNVPTINDLWRSHRKHKSDDFGWEPPENLGCAINTVYNDAGPSYFEDEANETVTLYFTSDGRPDSLGGFDIYASTLQEDGTFGPGVPVRELSSPFRDTRTAIRKDGLEIFISTERPGGVDGRDIWVATRPSTSDPWSAPEPLGPTINSACLDGAPALSWDGRELYFYSTRPLVTGGPCGKADLYVARRRKLDE